MDHSLLESPEIIIKLHKGQVDLSGQPYALHPLRVANNVTRVAPEANDDIVMAALLHDTIEDCGITGEFLREKGYSEACIEIVRLVSKPKLIHSKYEELINNLIATNNSGALLVKLCDNMDNLHPQRIRSLAEQDPEKAERLQQSYRASNSALGAELQINQDKID